MQRTKRGADGDRAPKLPPPVLTGSGSKGLISARGAANAAVEASRTEANPLAVAIAKARCGEAAGKGADIAHQVHAAMGYTREHNLHFSTRRLWAWRDEFEIGRAHV